MLHVGVDLHKRQAQIAVVDDAGTVRTNCAVACDRESMREFFGSLSEPVEVVMEATSSWYWLCDLLDEMEIEASLSHPLKTKAIASARIKTDKIDAATLAQLLRTNLLPKAHLASSEARLSRELLRHRAMLVRLRTGVKNRVQALLAKHNLRVLHGFGTPVMRRARAFLKAAARGHRRPCWWEGTWITPSAGLRGGRRACYRLEAS